MLGADLANHIRSALGSFHGLALIALEADLTPTVAPVRARRALELLEQLHADSGAVLVVVRPVLEAVAAEVPGS